MERDTVARDVYATCQSANQPQDIDEQVDQQCRLIGHTLAELLRDIAVEELNTGQRLNFVAKILQPYVRMLALQYTMQRVQQPDTEEEAFLGELRQQLRFSLGDVAMETRPAQSSGTG